MRELMNRPDIMDAGMKELMMRSIARLILSQQISTKCKKSLTPILQYFLVVNEDKPFQIIVEQIVAELNTNLVALEKNIATTSDTQQLIGILQVMDTITHASAFSRGLEEYYSGTVNKFCTIGKYAI